MNVLLVDNSGDDVKSELSARAISWIKLSIVRGIGIQQL